jgi:hypothetical protein
MSCTEISDNVYYLFGAIMSQPFEKDNDAYQVDLVTNLFAILIIFLLIFIATQFVETPENHTRYVKKDPETEDFTLLRQRFFRPFTDFFLVSTNRFYKLDLEAIAHVHRNTLGYSNSNTFVDKNGAEIFVMPLHPSDKRDINSFSLKYTLKAPLSPKMPWLQAIGNTEQFLSFVEENTYAQHKVATFFIFQAALDSFVPVSEYLTSQGYKFQVRIITQKNEIGFKRSYQDIKGR